MSPSSASSSRPPSGALRKQQLLVAVLCCAIATPAAGAEPDAYAIEQPSGKIAAESLFREGVALMERGEFHAACPKLEASEALDMAVGTLLYLGDCYERTGRLASAWARFSEASSLAGAQGMPERQRIANERAAALESKVARLTIVAPSAQPPGFSVRLAGALVPAASWGTALPVDAGSLVLEAAAPGHQPYRKSLEVPTTPAARVTAIVPPLAPLTPNLRAKPAPSSSVAPTSYVKHVDTGHAWRATGIAFVSVGAAGLVGSGVLAALASRANEKSRRECPHNPNQCTRRGVDLRQEAALEADLATTALAGGSFLAVTGLFLYVLPGSNYREERVTIALEPNLAQRGLAIRARGAF